MRASRISEFGRAGRASNPNDVPREDVSFETEAAQRSLVDDEHEAAFGPLADDGGAGPHHRERRGLGIRAESAVERAPHVVTERAVDFSVFGHAPQPEAVVLADDDELA